MQLLYGSARSVVLSPSSSLSFVSCIAQGLGYGMGSGTCRIKLWFKAKILPNSWMRMEMSSSSLKRNRRTVIVLQREQGHPAIPFSQKQRSVSKLIGIIGLSCERFKNTSENKELSKEMGEAGFGPEHSHLPACQGRKQRRKSLRVQATDVSYYSQCTFAVSSDDSSQDQSSETIPTDLTTKAD